MRYDLHQHLWPERFLEALRARHAPPLLENGDLVTEAGRFPIELATHDVRRRLELMDELETDVAVLSLQTTLGLERLGADEREALEQTWADGVAEVVAQSAGRFLALSPSRAREGFAGISVSSSSLRPDASFLSEAAAQGGFLFVHPGGAGIAEAGRPAWWDWVVGYPAGLQAAYVSWLAQGRARYPTVRILFAMLAGGGPFLLERATHQGLDVRSALDPNTFFEVSTHGRRAIELCIETFGVTQIAYGSDTPVVDPRTTLAAVRGFGDAVVNVLHTETPEALLS